MLELLWALTTLSGILMQALKVLFAIVGILFAISIGIVIIKCAAAVLMDDTRKGE